MMLAFIIPQSHSKIHNFIQSNSYQSNWSEYYCNFWSIFYEKLSHNSFQQNPNLSIDIRNEVRVTFDFVETCNGLMLNTDNYTPELFSLTMTVTKEGKKLLLSNASLWLSLLTRRYLSPNENIPQQKCKFLVFQNQEVFKLAKN